MNKPGDRDPLEVMADRNPAPIEQVEASFPPNERSALRDAAIARAHENGNSTAPRAPRRRRRALRFAMAGCAAALILTLVLALGGSSNEPASPGVEYAAAAVRTAEVNPRILVTAPGWSITHVEPLEPHSGETQFSDGTSRLEITWYPARLYDGYRRDRANVKGPDVPIDVLGVTGTMVRYSSSDFATMLPPQGDVFVEIRGELGSEEAYREILDSLEMTDVDTWLAAMPADVVRPDQQPELVDELLKGVPLPPGFDRDKLERQAVLNANGLRLKVADTVACGWLDSWARADRSGDEAAKAKATAAMATAPDWPPIVDPPKHGVEKPILDYARQIADDRLDRSFGGVMSTTAAGVTHSYGPAYAVVLSCDSMVKRLVDSP